MHATIRAALAAFVCILPGAGFAQPPEPTTKIDAYTRCTHSLNWCWKVVTDPITHHTDAMATLWSGDKLWMHRQLFPMALMLTCGDGKPWAFLAATTGTISYLPVDVRYRVEPGGVLGSSRAEHMQEGRIFNLGDGFVADVRAGETVTMRISHEGDGANGVVSFKIKGAAAVLDRLNCAKPEK